MAFAAKRFFKGALSATLTTTLYTNPGGVTSIVFDDGRDPTRVRVERGRQRGRQRPLEEPFRSECHDPILLVVVVAHVEQHVLRCGERRVRVVATQDASGGLCPGSVRIEHRTPRFDVRANN